MMMKEHKLDYLITHFVLFLFLTPIQVLVACLWGAGFYALQLIYSLDCNLPTPFSWSKADIHQVPKVIFPLNHILIMVPIDVSRKLLHHHWT